MLSVKFFGTEVRFYFGFFAMLTFSMLTGESDTYSVTAALVCALLHELGHLTAMFLASSPPEKLCFYAGGIKIIPDRKHMPSKAAKTVILFAGCTVNFLLAAVSKIIGADSLFEINLTLAIINLAPFKYFDGGRIISLYFSENIRRIIAFILLFAIAAALIYCKSIGIYALAVLIFVSISEIFM